MNRTFFAFAMQHFSLIDLKTFHAVADEGNLTRGAARVHLSPSTVCARIKGLESSLGVPLFTRSAQGMAVKSCGRELFALSATLMACFAISSLL